MVPHQRQLRSRPRPARRGIALLLVLAVIAAASVMGMAILSMGSLQAEAGNNSRYGPQLDGLADSGVNVALYYLQNPWKIGVASNSYWKGQSNISFGSSVSGTVNVAISSLGSSTYKITSTATLNNLTKTSTATVLVNLEFQPKAAAVFNQAVTVNSKTTITGDIWSSSTFTNSGANITGTVTAPSGNPAPDLTMPATEPQVVPTAVKYYFTYTYNGVIGIADFVGSTITSAPTASATNPGSVFYCLGNCILGGNFTIPGTLIVNNGRLSARAINTITPKSGMPALVCDNEIEMNGNNRSLTLNGLAWVGQGVKGAGGTTSSDVLTVNGSLYFKTGNFASTYTGRVVLNYDASKVTGLSGFTSTNQMPKNVKVLSWK